MSAAPTNRFHGFRRFPCLILLVHHVKKGQLVLLGIDQGYSVTTLFELPNNKTCCSDDQVAAAKVPQPALIRQSLLPGQHFQLQLSCHRRIADGHVLGLA